MAAKCRWHGCNGKQNPLGGFKGYCEIHWWEYRAKFLKAKQKAGNKMKKKHCKNCGQFMTAKTCNSKRCLERRGKPISKGSKMEFLQNILKMFKSKKFCSMVLGILIPVLNKAFGWGLDVTDILIMLGNIGVYNVAQGIADAGSKGKTSSM